MSNPFELAVKTATNRLDRALGTFPSLTGNDSGAISLPLIQRLPSFNQMGNVRLGTGTFGNPFEFAGSVGRTIFGGFNPFSFGDASARTDAEKAARTSRTNPPGGPIAPNPDATGAYTSHARLSHLQPYISKYAAEGGYPEMLAALTALAESDGDPMAFNDRSFATGLFQALPRSYAYPGGGRGSAYRYGGGGRTDPGIQALYDIDLQFQLAQPEFQAAWRQATQEHPETSVEQFVRAVALAQRYENYQDPYSRDNNRVRQIASEIYGGFYPAVPPGPAGAVPNSVVPQTAAGRFTGINQFELPLDARTAAEVCGPAAAMAFAQWAGRMPTVSEAMAIARQPYGNTTYWQAGRGMVGPDSFVAMLSAMGLQAEATARIDPARMIREVQAGRPVIIDTPLHYYQVTGYDPTRDMFQFGDGVGRNRWSSLANLGQWNFGDPRTVIYAR